MYVCICHAVNERMIEKACQNGTRSLSELSRELGVGQGCGKCVQHACQTMEACHKQAGRGRAAS